MNDGSNKGELHIIFGPMFAGKSTALIERVFEEEKKGKTSILVKPEIDSRYSRNCVVTHSGYEKSCYTVRQLKELEVEIGKKEFKKLNVIGIDEAQFFPDLYKFCERNVDHEKKIVVVAGLDGDCRRKKFGAILDLIPISNSVTKLTSTCNVCQKVALFTFKHSSIYGQGMIGGNELYEPLCRDHHEEKHEEKQLKEFIRLKIGFLPNRKRIVMKWVWILKCDTLRETLRAIIKRFGEIYGWILLLPTNSWVVRSRNGRCFKIHEVIRLKWNYGDESDLLRAFKIINGKDFCSPEKGRGITERALEIVRKIVREIKERVLTLGTVRAESLRRAGQRAKESKESRD